MQTLLRLLAAAALLSFGCAQAAWNADWPQRVKITLDPAAAGLLGPLSQLPVLVRLHTGNFDFSKAKPDGSDLRFIAADDKTPLKHHLERWDPQNELALAWVLVPSLAPGQADAGMWLYYGNAKAPSVDDAKGVLDAQHVAVFHFEEASGAPRDSTGFANNATKGPAQRAAAAIIGAGALFDGKETIALAPSPSIKFGPGGFTFSAWIKPAGDTGTLYAQKDGNKGISVSLARGSLNVSIPTAKSTVKASGGSITAGAWTHVAVSAGKRLVLYVNGEEVAAADAELAEIAGEVTIGEGFPGEMDEVEVSSAARGADWMRAAAKGQGEDAALLAFGEAESGGGGTGSYIGFLLGAVTLDGWVVIGVLGIMLVVSVWVVGTKTAYINRNERDNRAFLDAFHRNQDLIALPAGFESSSLQQVYRAGADEVKGRVDGRPAERIVLSPKAIESVRARIDAARVRESQKLNRSMVLLTIAISGGPFLGLLGTVVGVMITFAAIAATGDVNVAAIAPGIAAALVATVAGLLVAIPALFAYNYIGTRIKNIVADMQVFADEFVARIAETYEN